MFLSLQRWNSASSFRCSNWIVYFGFFLNPFLIRSALKLLMSCWGLLIRIARYSKGTLVLGVQGTKRTTWNKSLVIQRPRFHPVSAHSTFTKTTSFPYDNYLRVIVEQGLLSKFRMTKNVWITARIINACVDIRNIPCTSLHITAKLLYLFEPSSKLTLVFRFLRYLLSNDSFSIIFIINLML